MKPNTNYGLRPPSHDELRATFGSLQRCVDTTGGDIPTVLYYLNNPDRIESAGPVPRALDAYAEQLYEAALAESAEAAWDESGEKPTIKAVSKKLGVCRPVARRALVNAGKWVA